VVKRAFQKASEDILRSDYRLVKLKAETVQDLNRLKDETGQASLNDLITKMIQVTDAYRTGLKETGWESSRGRG
jgi:hypothetical protein